MYAKLKFTGSNLVARSTSVTCPANMIRDIVRLCTSNTPNTSLLMAFSNTESTIIDSTPAGWTMIFGGTGGTIEASINYGGSPINMPDANNLVTSLSASYNTNQFTYVMSAPCLGPRANTVKYAKLTTTANANFSLTGNTGSFWINGISLTSCASANGDGTVTGEGFRTVSNNFIAVNPGTWRVAANSFNLAGNGFFHLIATPRHITIIKEDTGGTYDAYTGYPGVHAVFEHTITDYHTFYGIAPVVQLNFKGLVGTGASSGGRPVSTAPTIFDSATQSYPDNAVCLFNITDQGTLISYSAVSLGYGHYHPYLFPGYSGNYNGIGGTANPNMKTVASNGQARNLVIPLMFNANGLGVPTCFISDVSDVYWAAGNIGTTGDTFVFNSNTYTYFDAGLYGLAIGRFG